MRRTKPSAPVAPLAEPTRARRRPAPRERVSVVTGGAGFVGSHLVDLLLKQGQRVVVVDNLITGSTENIAHLAGNPRFRFIRQDVTEFLFLSGPVDYVWHFASPASPGSDPKEHGGHRRSQRENTHLQLSSKSRDRPPHWVEHSKPASHSRRRSRRYHQRSHGKNLRGKAGSDNVIF